MWPASCTSHLQHPQNSGARRALSTRRVLRCPCQSSIVDSVTNPLVGIQRRRLVCALAALVPTIGLQIGLQSSADVPLAEQATRIQPADVNLYWNNLVTYIRTQLGADFDANLVFYDKKKPALLPSGIPGDPAKDFTSKKDCGTFRPGQDVPYAMCGPPGALPADLTSRECCRHFAYCITRGSRYALAAADKVNTVIVSPRITALPDATWQAMLVHEMGHCIDFHVYGGRYRLTDHSVADPQVAAALAGIAAVETDPELRADLMADALLRPFTGRRLCYNPATTLQVLLEPATPCEGSGEAGDDRFLRHYTHPPLQGSVAK